MKDFEERYWKKVDIPHGSFGCWTWTGVTNRFRKYGKIRQDGRYVLAHRVVWALVHGPISLGVFVCHHCDNPSCVNPSHLFLGTHTDNMCDMVSKGRGNIGEKNGSAKLTESNVRDIRASNLSGTALARRFGVSTSMISLVRIGTNWKHLLPVENEWQRVPQDVRREAMEER